MTLLTLEILFHLWLKQIKANLFHKDLTENLKQALKNLNNSNYSLKN
jgi:hypothetical protein